MEEEQRRYKSREWSLLAVGWSLYRDSRHLRLPEQDGAQQHAIMDGDGAFQAQPLPERLWFVGKRKAFLTTV